MVLGTVWILSLIRIIKGDRNMSRVKKAAETSEEFAKSIKKWLGIERATISITKKML